MCHTLKTTTTSGERRQHVLINNYTPTAKIEQRVPSWLPKGLDSTSECLTDIVCLWNWCICAHIVTLKQTLTSFDILLVTTGWNLEQSAPTTCYITYNLALTVAPPSHLCPAQCCHTILGHNGRKLMLSALTTKRRSRAPACVRQKRSAVDALQLLTVLRFYANEVQGFSSFDPG